MYLCISAKIRRKESYIENMFFILVSYIYIFLFFIEIKEIQKYIEQPVLIINTLSCSMYFDCISIDLNYSSSST